MTFLSSRYVVSFALTVSLGTLLCAARGEREEVACRLSLDASLLVSPPVARARPIPGIFFTATPRGGNRLTEAADLLIADTSDGKPVARYARIRFSAGT